MTRRLKSAEESARRDREASRRTLAMQLADSMKPPDSRLHAAHYRAHLSDAHTLLEQLQTRISALESEVRKVKFDRDNILHRSVTITVAEEERRRAAAGMRERAATMMELDGGILTQASEDIRALPDPRPRWSRA